MPITTGDCRFVCEQNVQERERANSGNCSTGSILNPVGTAMIDMAWPAEAIDVFSGTTRGYAGFVEIRASDEK